METEVYRRLESIHSDTRLAAHRLAAIEKEDLPKRVAQIEPVVSRVEDKVDELVAKVDSMGTSIGEVKSAQKGMIWVVGAIVGLIQLVPVVKDLLTGGAT